MVWIRRHGGVMFGLLAIIGWAWIVWQSGMGWNPSGIQWSFENTAQLGDSFGVLSSIMAAIAAYFAFRTYQSARDDVARLERRAAEPSYLNLLERRFDVLDRVHTSETRVKFGGGVSINKEEWHGQDALNWAVSGLRRERKDDNRPLSERYVTAVSETSGLSNLFRFTYHIISFANRQFSQVPSSEATTKDDPAYQYVRLLRAQMSDSELVLIALNCAFGPGHEKFKPFVEQYALLHNMNPSDRTLFGLDDLFEPSAFGITAEDRIAHGDGPPKLLEDEVGSESIIP